MRKTWGRGDVETDLTKIGRMDVYWIKAALDRSHRRKYAITDVKSSATISKLVFFVLHIAQEPETCKKWRGTHVICTVRYTASHNIPDPFSLRNWVTVATALSQVPLCHHQRARSSPHTPLWKNQQTDTHESPI